jgi:hypothetical protein
MLELAPKWHVRDKLNESETVRRFDVFECFHMLRVIYKREQCGAGDDDVEDGKADPGKHAAVGGVFCVHTSLVSQSLVKID